MMAMSRKKDMSSLGVVSTEREGVSQLWAVNGREVSMVRVEESSAEEIERRREGAEENAEEMGLRRLDLDEEEEEAKRERAIRIC